METELTQTQQFYVRYWGKYFNVILREISDEDLTVIAPFIDLDIGFAYCTTGEAPDFMEKMLEKMKQEFEKLKSNSRALSFCSLSSEIQTPNQWKILLKVDKDKKLDMDGSDQMNLLVHALYKSDDELLDLVLGHKELVYDLRSLYYNDNNNWQRKTPMYKLFLLKKPEEEETQKLVLKLYSLITNDLLKPRLKGDVYCSLTLHQQWTKIPTYEKLFSS